MPTITTLSTTSTTPIPPVLVRRATYDAENSNFPTNGLGKLVRVDDAPRTGDLAVDAAHDNAKVVIDFYREVLGRNSIDNKGMAIESVVHFGKNYNNAYWDGSKMTYGDGDGKFFRPLSMGLDVVGHEITHGVAQYTAGLAYRNQSGALNESFSDVLGEVIEQWSENRAGFGTLDAVKGADWLVGEDVMTPDIAGDALRSLKSPGTAYAGDKQPNHMDSYVKTTSDNGGVHINSGIPNKAAYDTALKIGSEKLAKIWYSALTDYLRSTSTFVDAARATYTASLKLYGEGLESQAVLDAWKGVGVLREPTPPTLMTLRGFDNGFKGIHAPHNPTMFPSDYRWT